MKNLVIASAVVLSLVGCVGDSSGGYADTADGEGGYVGNPYSEGTGHYAGYEWAERTGGDCDGNSQSFNEGCEAYYEQTGE